MQAVDREVLRIALDRSAKEDYGKMVAVLRAKSEFVKLNPSSFVSFLVSDFFRTHFEKDLPVLLAEFFDSQSYYETKAKVASKAVSFEKEMLEALNEIKKIRNKRRRAPRDRVKYKSNKAEPNENV